MSVVSITVSMPDRANQRGFTIIELAVIFAVIAILVTIVVVVNLSWGMYARDQSRASAIHAIAGQLERYYRLNAVAAGPTYPPASMSSADFTALIANQSLTSAPDQTTTSIVMATTAGTPAMNSNQYVYQAMNADSTICTSTPCVKFALYYQPETSSTPVRLDSMRQQ